MSRTLKNIPQDNFFRLLNLSVSFDIDREKLNNNYHEIQKSIHPDNYANSSALERRISVQKAAQVNDALQTLKSPLLRSIYLLSLYGIELAENNTTVDPAFLMEQMELRESLAQVAVKDDPFAELDKILDDVKSRIKMLIADLSSRFQQLLLNKYEQSEQQKLLQDIKTQVLKMQFLNRVQEECMNKEEELTDQL